MEKKDGKLPKVEIYSDGACRGNPGPGGWGTILVCGGVEKALCGGAARTTNNRMELTGAIEGLKALRRPCAVTLTSDSRYLVDGVTKGWAEGWKRRGWVKSDKKPALNPELWDELLTLLERHTVEFVWVKGHAGHPYNERCDAMATAEASKYEK